MNSNDKIIQEYIHIDGSGEKYNDKIIVCSKNNHDLSMERDGAQLLNQYIIIYSLPIYISYQFTFSGILVHSLILHKTLQMLENVPIKIRTLTISVLSMKI